jgi:hypothetical protein
MSMLRILSRGMLILLLLAAVLMAFRAAMAE